ncbi:MAG TPA: cellulase family glycosylhydrolase [Candidatus Binatia bacterium]|jgi:aryl-phospho-beta-D-glucosidase BglC (GH1 family)|nr:cellulase family glycosylhydrolase [Candidatus Binatia bacterium]
MRAFAVSLILAALTLPSLASAADCPSDAFDLWSNGILRGANVFQGRNPGGASTGFGDGDFAQSDFDDLAAAGANYVQISHAGLFAETPPYALDPAAEANLDRIISMASAANLYAVIAFRSGPGRNENAISNRDATVLDAIWTDQAAHDAWVAMLRHTAERYGSNPTVIGYSIMVEPNNYARHGFIDPPEFYLLYSGTIEDVNVLHAQAAAAIREVDTETPILLEPEGYGNVIWLPFVTPLADPRVVYTAHDYTPFDYSHQQMVGATYPGTYDVEGVATLVNKAFLTTYLQPLQTYVDTHGVPVALTEFGVHRDAPEAASYLADRIAIQDTLGSWAVWVWQPADFIDPFNMHEASPVLDVLKTAWAGNCRRGAGGGGGGGVATVEGRTRKARGNGTAGKPIVKVTVSVGTASVRTRKKPTKGSYALEVAAGVQTIGAVLGKRACHIGTPDGPASLEVTLAGGERRIVDVFCGRVAAVDP